MAELARSLESNPDYTEYISPEKWLHLGALLLTIALGELFFPEVTVWFLNQVANDLNNLLRASVEEIMFIAGVILIHELIHIVVSIRRGYRPKVGIRRGETFWLINEPHPYIIVLNKPLSRNDNMAMLIAPLLVISGITLIGLLPIFPAFIIYYAKVAFAMNTASSISDAYNFVRIWDLPEATEFINIMENDIRTFYRVPSQR